MFKVTRRATVATGCLTAFLWAGAHLLGDRATPGAGEAGSVVETVIPQGGAKIIIRSREQTSEKGVYAAQGDVEITYGEFQVQADRVEFDSGSKTVKGEGRVVFCTGKYEIRADKFQFDVEMKTGQFYGITGVSDATYRFSTGEFRKISEATYTFRDGRLTTCAMEKPHWGFSCREARFEKDRSITIRGGLFKIWGVPVFYFPWAKAPILRDERKSGFMIPSAGLSNLKGTVVSESAYLVLGRSADATLTGEYYSKRGWAFGSAFRTRPSESSHLNFSTYSVMDRLHQGGTLVNADSAFSLSNGLRGAFIANYATDRTFRQVFADSFVSAVQPDDILKGDVYKVWDDTIFSASVGRRRFFFVDGDILDRRTPVAAFDLVDKRVRGTPAYFSFTGSFGLLHKDARWTGGPPDDPQPYGARTPDAVRRAVLAPSLYLPFKLGDWLRATVSPFFRAVYYSDRWRVGALAPSDARETATEGKALWRRFLGLEATVDLPRLYRVFDKGGFRFKHVVESGVKWRMISSDDRYRETVLFDYSDDGTSTHEVEYFLTQRFFTMRGGYSREWLQMTVRQKYFFRPSLGGAIVPGVENAWEPLLSFGPYLSVYEPRRFTPVQLSMRFNPSDSLSGEVRVDFDTERGGVSDLSAFGTFQRDALFLSLAYVRVRSFETYSLQDNYVQASLGLGRLRKGWSGDFNVAYNRGDRSVENVYLRVNYFADCIGLSAEFIQYKLDIRNNDKEFRVSLYIKGFGDFGVLRNLGRRRY